MYIFSFESGISTSEIAVGTQKGVIELANVFEKAKVRFKVTSVVGELNQISFRASGYDYWVDKDQKLFNSATY